MELRDIEPFEAKFYRNKEADKREAIVDQVDRHTLTYFGYSAGERVALRWDGAAWLELGRD